MVINFVQFGVLPARVYCVFNVRLPKHTHILAKSALTLFAGMLHNILHLIHVELGR